MIRSLATYVPPRVLTNADLEQMVDTTDEWILQRTGIRERHIVDPGTATSDLAKEAAVKAIAGAGLTPEDIGFIVVGTVTPDMMFPSTACLLQHKIGAPRRVGIRYQRGVFGVHLRVDDGESDRRQRSARARARGRRRRDVQHHRLQGSRDLRHFRRRSRRGCRQRRSRRRTGRILDFEHEIDGGGGPSLCMPAGGSLHPSSHETVDQRLHYVKQDGQTVFKFAVRKTEEIARRVLERNRLKPGDLDLFVSHQANRRIIMSAAEKLELDPAKVDHQHRAVRQHDRGDNSAGA